MNTLGITSKNLIDNIVYGEEIAFLDLSISFDYLTNRIRTNLYTKPTNTYSYLLYNSNHPGHIFRNIPKSLFIRIFLAAKSR